MAAEDNFIVGNPIVSDTEFEADDFYDDFSTLDISTNPNFADTTGKWKRGLYAHKAGQYRMDWAYRGVLNNERQIYSSPDRPHPSGWSGISNSGIGVTLSSAPIDTGNSAEVAWAVNKAYHMTKAGEIATNSYFTAANGFPNGIPDYWGSYNVEADGKVLFQDYPMIVKSEMISTAGRFSFGMGRFQFRAKMPVGARIDDINDFLKIHCVFPAGWGVQQIHFGHDPNGLPLSNPLDTTMPAANGGTKTEFDTAEYFGPEFTKVHHTIHYYSGSPTILSNPFEYDIGLDPESNFVTYTMDIGPNKMAFGVNGVYTRVVDTPTEFSNRLPIYQTLPNDPTSLVKDASGRLIPTGEYQTNVDGSDRYMGMMIIFNVAYDGDWPRKLTKILKNNTLPPFSFNKQMQIDYVRFAPLKGAPIAGHVASSGFFNGTYGGGTGGGGTTDPTVGLIFGNNIGEHYTSGGAIYKIIKKRRNGGNISALAIKPS